MNIYLARHGTTNYNEQGLCNSDPSVDVHLTKKGIEQATNLAERLRTNRFDQIYISELKRTKQTAEIINKFHGSTVKIDPRLNDNRSGYEGQLADLYYKDLEKAANKWTVRLNDGESLHDVKLRVKSFIDELITQNHKSVLIVTSRVIVQTFYGLVNGLTDQETWDFEVDKGSCIELELN